MSSSDRQNNLLKVIVEEYIESATPVGSTLITKKYFSDLSSATIRNNMAELEKQGLICQPHTSAGRVPTTEGYKKYLKHFVHKGTLVKKEQTALDEIKIEDRQDMKAIARELAELSNNAVFVNFDGELFYTGISNLFRQPEFVEKSNMYDMSEIIDHIDEATRAIADQLETGQIKTIVGGDQFGQSSSVIIVKYKFSDGEGIIGILGPSRMNYRQGLGLIDYAHKLLSDI